ncbi:hypothetical protein F4778DRAFT_237566 [Xylariomycetidae sp. FL2044]|nr:hypothetical protein F4778DRAFT_237566 [Xylariomycetidae sp. FL2044]
MLVGWLVGNNNQQCESHTAPLFFILYRTKKSSRPRGLLKSAPCSWVTEEKRDFPPHPLCLDRHIHDRSTDSWELFPFTSFSVVSFDYSSKILGHTLSAPRRPLHRDDLHGKILIQSSHLKIDCESYFVFRTRSIRTCNMGLSTGFKLGLGLVLGIPFGGIFFIAIGLLVYEFKSEKPKMDAIQSAGGPGGGAVNGQGPGYGLDTRTDRGPRAGENVRWPSFGGSGELSDGRRSTVYRPSLAMKVQVHEGRIQEPQSAVVCDGY